MSSQTIDDRAETIAMIRESAAAFVAAGDGALARARALRMTATGFDRAVWRGMCDMGWVGLRVPEADGGAGLGMQEFCALTEELGAALVPEPLIPCSMAAGLLAGAALKAVLTGDKVAIPAWQERSGTLDEVVAAEFTAGRVNAAKQFVPLAAGADMFLVTTLAGTVAVERAAPGVEIRVLPTVDGGHFGTLTFTDAPGELVAQPSLERFGLAVDEAALATAAYLLGVMERSFAMTVSYLGERKQFGRAIGSFQVLQHRAVDLSIQLALTRASVTSAARDFDAALPPPARRAAASRAKARAAEAAMLVTRQAIQLHGAVGYTDEYDVGLYLRKAMVLANLYGSADAHRARYAATVAGVDED